MLKRIIAVLVGFCLSVCIRIPFLGQKLEGFGHQEWLAGHTLLILKIWKKDGIASHYYALPYTFYRKADKHIPFIPGVMDTRGNGYYVSYPPLAFYVLYAMTSVFYVPANEVFLQVITLLIQLITGTLLYILLKKCHFSDKIAVFCAWGYFLLPVTLRYHTQAYFCDILAQIGIVSTLILHQNYLQKPNFKNAFVTGLSLFVLTFTEWIGVFLTLVIVVHCFFIQKAPSRALHSLIWLLFMLFAIALTLWIYSHIAGWRALLEALVHKANQRAISDSTKYFSRWHLETYSTILRYYVVHYYPAGLSMLIIATGGLKKQNTIKLPNIFGIILVAIVLHHVIFLNFTAENDFSVLKTSIAILMLWAFLIFVSKFSVNMLYLSYAMLLVGAFYVTYKGIKRPKENQIQRFASELVRLSSNGEVLVLHSSSSISPQVMYYAERNVYMNLPKNEVKTHLKKHNLNKAIVVYTDWQYNIQKTEVMYAE